MIIPEVGSPVFRDGMRDRKVSKPDWTVNLCSGFFITELSWLPIFIPALSVSGELTGELRLLLEPVVVPAGDPNMRSDSTSAICGVSPSLGGGIPLF